MSYPASITVRVPLAIRRRPGRKTVVMPGGATPTMRTHADPALLKALARAFRWQRLLEEGRYASISELAVAERIERGYLDSLLRLTLLAPELVEAIINGRQRDGLSLPTLMAEFSEIWPTHISHANLGDRWAGSEQAAHRHASPFVWKSLMTLS